MKPVAQTTSVVALLVGKKSQFKGFIRRGIIDGGSGPYAMADKDQPFAKIKDHNDVALLGNEEVADPRIYLLWKY